MSAGGRWEDDIHIPTRLGAATADWRAWERDAHPVIPLRREGNGWTATALDGNQRPVTLLYDPVRGLRFA